MDTRAYRPTNFLAIVQSPFRTYWVALLYANAALRGPENSSPRASSPFAPLFSWGELSFFGGLSIWKRGSCVNEKDLLARPQFFGKRSLLPARIRKEMGRSHGVQAGKIRIIILRRFIIPWTGPSLEGICRGRWFCSVSPLSYFPSGLSLRRRRGRVHRK
jgi:hypothetical protein